MYFFTSSFVFIIVFLSIFVYSSLEYKKRQSYVINFETYIAVLDYHLNKCFEIIHKDQILIYSLKATKMDDEEFSNTSKNFCNLVLKMLGPTLLQEFTYLYGDLDTFLFVIVEYFNTRFEDDEIRKGAIENLTNEE